METENFRKAGFLFYRGRESRKNSNYFLALKRERERGGERKVVYGHFLGRFGRRKQGTKILELWMKAWVLFGGCLRNSRHGRERNAVCLNEMKREKREREFTKRSEPKRRTEQNRTPLVISDISDFLWSLLCTTYAACCL